MKHRYVIQNNLIAENDLKQLQNACLNNNIEFEEVTVIPFTTELPKFTLDEKSNIYYGSTTFINNVFQQLKPASIFFDPSQFLISNYISRYKDLMLNSEARLTTIREFIKEDLADDSLWFVRPDADDKSFDGNVMSFSKLKNWQSNMLQFDDTKLTLDSKIIINAPYNLKKEWRNFVVNGEVVTSSLYRENFRLKKSNTDIPLEMLEFVKRACEIYQPAKAFAMDIALCGDEYYIIECGCINSVGFYHADIEKLVKALTTVC